MTAGRARELRAALALVALVVVAYWPAFSAGWVWDDGISITGNAALRTWQGLADVWFRPGATLEYYPVTYTTHWVERRLFGASPFAHHAVNVALHAVAACTLWRVARALDLRGAWTAAAVFALHPVHVASVAWAVERKNVLSCLGALLATRAWIAYVDGRRRRHLALATLAFAAAMLAKPAVAPLPVVLLLIAWWRRGDAVRDCVRASLPLFAIAVALGALHVALEGRNLASTLLAVDASVVDRVLAAGRAPWFYAGKLVFPHPLVPIYAPWDVVGARGIHALLLAATLAVPFALWMLRERIGRGPFVAVTAFLVMLAPASGVVAFSFLRFAPVADHLVYAPSIALTTGAVAVAATGIRAWSVRRAAAAMVLAALGALTFRQAALYESNARLFEHNVAHAPEAWGAHDQLGGEALKARDFAAAERHYSASLRLAPANPVALANLGPALAALGRDADARAALERALERLPDDPSLRVNLATVLERQGELALAAAEYERALSRDPRSISALNNLALLHERAGRLDDALGLLRRARAIRADVPAIEENLRRIERARGGG